MTDDYIQFVNDKLMEYLPTDRVRSGDSIVFRCPFCGDSRKSSIKKRGYYTPSKCLYHCFNCETSMSGLKLLEQLSGSDFDRIKLEYGRAKIRSSVSSRPKVLTPASAVSKLSDLVGLVPRIREDWKLPLSQAATEYLDHRKVLSAPFLRDRLYSCQGRGGLEYILIPWKLNGVECYYQFNDFQRHNADGRKYIFPSKLQKVVFGLDNIDVSFPYVICFEGVYDSVFVKNGVCIGGKSLTPLQEQIISLRYPRHRIVLAFDNDAPGREATRRAIERTGGKFKYFKWYSEHEPAKDINDYVLETGDVSAFANPAVVEGMVVSPIVMRGYC